ncbi:hypothetical protein ATCVGM07011_431R [Acanthocystis turfacea Chlorella virus GM0701.1]|nr:hypothetical protein ATCVGM07011_431R [Acanthocystis turfacea Chlorella virus GM0701.1]
MSTTSIQGSVVNATPTMVRIQFTGPNGAIRTPLIPQQNTFKPGDPVTVVVKSTPPFEFLSVSAPAPAPKPAPVPVPVSKPAPVPVQVPAPKPAPAPIAFPPTPMLQPVPFPVPQPVPSQVQMPVFPPVAPVPVPVPAPVPVPVPAPVPVPVPAPVPVPVPAPVPVPVPAPVPAPQSVVTPPGQGEMSIQGTVLNATPDMVKLQFTGPNGALRSPLVPQKNSYKVGDPVTVIVKSTPPFDFLRVVSAPAPVPAPAPVSQNGLQKPATPAQDDITIRGSVLNANPAMVKIQFTGPNGKLRTPLITQKNNFSNGDAVSVVVKSVPPYEFVKLNPVTVATPVPVPVATPVQNTIKQPALPAQDDISVQGTILDANPAQARVKFTDPDGKLRTPVIVQKNDYVNGDNVVVLLKSKAPYEFVKLYKPNEGPSMLPVPDITDRPPVLPMTEVLKDQSVITTQNNPQPLTFPIAPTSNDTTFPDTVNTACVLDAIKKCGTKSSTMTGNFNLGAYTTMPMPVPMAPRSTFSDSFVNKINNNNIINNIDYTVDLEVDTTPFVEYRSVPPKDLGEEIPSRGDTLVPRNILKASSVPIVDSEETPVMSRADVPIVDMLGNEGKAIGTSIAMYIKQIGEMIFSYTKDLASNETISQVFKDNSKIIALLIAVAAGSFIMNAGIAAIVVGIVLLIATKNVTKLF